MFHGAQTRLQLLPPEVYSGNVLAGADWQIPFVKITDQPRFRWRGLMLDVGRHFFTKLEVMQLLDAMALRKINTFHWHLVDDNGWRIEIKFRLLPVAGSCHQAACHRRVFAAGKVYSLEPIPAQLASEMQKHILGARGNVWTEYIPNLRHVEHMTFPRLSALAEVTWSAKAAPTYDDFLRRLKTDEQRLGQLGGNYHKSALGEDVAGGTN